MASGKVLALDFGRKRTGVAISDERQVFAFGLTAIPTSDIFLFLKGIIEKEKPVCIVIGEAKRESGEDSEVEKLIQPLLNHLKNKYREIAVERQDETLSSVKAVQSMVAAGFKKKDRRKKENVDQMSATLILQAFLERKQGS